MVFGNEEEVYHRQKIILDRKLKECSYWVDDYLLAILKIDDATPHSAKFFLQAQKKGTDFILKVKNATVKATGKFIDKSESHKENEMF